MISSNTAPILDNLKVDIIELEKRDASLLGKSFDVRRQIGKKLNEAKKMLLHGQFEAWVIKAGFTMSAEQRSRLMKLDKHWEDVEPLIKSREKSGRRMIGLKKALQSVGAIRAEGTSKGDDKIGDGPIRDALKEFVAKMPAAKVLFADEQKKLANKRQVRLRKGRQLIRRWAKKPTDTAFGDFAKLARFSQQTSLVFSKGVDINDASRLAFLKAMVKHKNTQTK